MTLFKDAGMGDYGSIHTREEVRALLAKGLVVDGEELAYWLDNAHHALSEKFILLKNWLFRATCVCGGVMSRAKVRANLQAMLDTGAPLDDLRWFDPYKED